MIKTEKILDCQDLACPQPVIKTKDAIEKMGGIGQLTVIVDNEAACSNVSRFAGSRGYSVIVTEKGGDIYYLAISQSDEVSGSDADIACEVVKSRSMVVYITSEVMGQGDDELGHILMAAYFETLVHFAKNISHIIFINSGVKLAVAGSPVLDELQGLVKMGTETLACGACLKHFGLTKQLEAGSVSNMFTILEILARSGKVLTP